jgi:hypothetical protein
MSLGAIRQRCGAPSAHQEFRLNCEGTLAHLPICSALPMRMRVQRRNHDGLLEHLTEPLGQARRRAAELIRDAA